MAATKIAGVYKITNLIDGRVYIGSSKDLLHRMKQYKWAAKSDKNYTETRKTVCIDMRKLGIENFDFEVIEYGDEFKNQEYRLLRETYYILKYDATNPAKGYNKTKGGEFGIGSPRKQKAVERNLRTDPIYTVSVPDRSIIIYLGGAKLLADETGHDRTVVTRAIKHGHHFESRIYIFYMDKEKRDQTLDYVIRHKSADMLQGYLAAYHFLEENE